MKDLVLPSVFTFGSFFIIFLFCELGERIICKSEEGYNDLMQTKWYLAPLSLKKILPIVMCGIQEPFQLSGIGSIVCTREIFKNVSY